MPDKDYSRFAGGARPAITGESCSAGGVQAAWRLRPELARRLLEEG